MAMYEPSHGSAPKYAGLNKVNPLATILSAGLMLKYSFGYDDAPVMLEAAVLDILNAGFGTYDIAFDGSTVLGTAEMGDKVAAAILAKTKTPV